MGHPEEDVKLKKKLRVGIEVSISDANLGGAAVACIKGHRRCMPSVCTPQVIVFTPHTRVFTRDRQSLTL